MAKPRQIDDSRWLWMVGKSKGSRGEQNQVSGVTQNQRKSRQNEVEKSRVFQALVTDVLGFPAKWMTGYDGRSSSFRLVSSLTGGAARITRYGRVDFWVKRVGFRVGLQLLSTLLHVCICSPVSSFFFYFYVLFNRLAFFFPSYVT